MAVRTRYPLAATLPPELLDRTVVPRFGFPFRLLLLLCLLPILLGATVLASYRQSQEERVYTGVRVFGIDLSRMTRQEAAGAIRQQLVTLGSRPFELRFDGEAIDVTLAKMGLTVDSNDVNALGEQAWAVGRNDDLRTWLVDQLVLLRHGFDLPVTAQFDRERALAEIARHAPVVERVTLNADLSVQRAGDRLEVHTKPAQVGRRINVAATLDRLQQAMAGTLPTHLDLVLDEAPPAITDEDIAPAREAVEHLLGSPFEFRDGARVWRLEPNTAFEMLEITGLKEARPPVAALLNEEKLAQFVERTVRLADDPAINPFFEIENGEVVVRQGRSGRLADAPATFELARQAINGTGAKSVDIVFKEDKPWLQPQDLEPARAQANAVLDVPIQIETPAQPGIVAKQWTLTRADLVQFLVLPSTRNAPRDYATLQPALRPRFEIALDSGRVANFLGREIAPWVSEDPVDAALELKTTRIELPNPDYSPETTLPPTLTENRYRVELLNARDGRGPDYDGTFAVMQAALRASYLAPPDAEKTPQRVTVRLAPRRPRVVDTDLALAQAQANTLIEEPVAIRWLNNTWTVTRDELNNMLRYQPGRDGKLTAYLSRDGLLAKATAIAREAERNPRAPRSSWDELLPVDIPNTARAIWNAAQAPLSARSGDVVWNDEDPALMKPEADLPGGPTSGPTPAPGATPAASGART